MRLYPSILAVMAGLLVMSCSYSGAYDAYPGEDRATQPALATTAGMADPCHQGGQTYCALNPQVTQGTIRSTICRSGWTATVRPPSSYTGRLKRQQMAALHLPGGADAYEEDHRMPLELGGAPSDPSNLTPEAHSNSYTKDSEENVGRRAVCSGRMFLAQAQAAMVARWLGPWPQFKEYK